jgi:hypothetical protein
LSQFKQEPEGQAGLQVQPVEASQVCLEAHGPA